MRRGRRAIPYIAQAEMADCGAAALAMALGYHGRHVSLAEMHEATGTGRDGVDALRLAEAASSFGLRARGVATELDDLRDLARGTILHWGAAHFVVIDSTSRRGVTIVATAQSDVDGYAPTPADADGGLAEHSDRPDRARPIGVVRADFPTRGKQRR